ncbi:rRNA-processing efg-1 [Apiospora kogelbergensis]|uniref:rRNA-processing protein EFG1 n=1 Tax=Apiospora kogelbergensis TaxID=1337665 RepID=A0AAW0Q7C9_9PEZI
MGDVKRKHSDGDAGSQAPKRRKNLNGKVSKARPDNINWLKKRARNIERQFRSAQKLPADKRNELERELAHSKQKIQEASNEKQRKQMITKYHMVRFFERKKADKLAKQILKQLRACEDKEERTQLEKDLHEFPYLEPYISLYPVKASSPATKDGEQTETASKAAQALRTERPPIWHEIEQAVKEGTPAVIALRERDIRKGETRASKGSKAQDAKTSSSKDGKQKDVKMKDSISKPDEDSDDDSDGGFFEGA